jgi:hypothetical protein
MTCEVLAWLVVAASPLVCAADLGEWRDLHVYVDALREPILVNGVPLEVSRVTGRDVSLLAKRLNQKWSEESGSHGVRTEVHGAWTILSRIHDAGLEVVQWRGSGKDAELLWSRGDLKSRFQSPARVGLRFPAACVPGRTVSGKVDAHSYLQRVAACVGSPRATLSAVRAIAGSQGFEVRSRDGQLLARDRATETTVLAWPSAGAGASATSLVYLQLNRPQRGQ